MRAGRSLRRVRAVPVLIAELPDHLGTGTGMLLLGGRFAPFRKAGCRLCHVFNPFDKEEACSRQCSTQNGFFAQHSV